MEATAQNKTGAATSGLEIQLAMATEYRRFARRVMPNTGAVVGATMRIIELGWAIEDVKRRPQ